jgi:four helix bundle protein
LQRASLSVSLNIAEGYARRTRAQFHYGLTVAYGSAVESAEILNLLVEEGVIERGKGLEAIRIATACQQLLIGLMRRYGKGKPRPAE